MLHLLCVTRSGRLVLGACRHVPSRASSSRTPYLPLDLLMYSSVLPDKVVDKSRKTSSYRLGEQGKLRIEKDNQDLERELRKIGPAEDPSVALSYLYPGVTSVQQMGATTPDELIEMAGEDDLYTIEETACIEKPVYSYNLFLGDKQKSAEAIASLEQVKQEEASPSEAETEEPKGDSRAHRGRRRLKKQKLRASEQEREFEVVDAEDSLEAQEAERLLANDAQFRFGSFDPAIPLSRIPCGGCGALLHCQDPKAPGFVPVEVYEDKSENDLRLTLCQRCHVMKEYNIALKMNVDPEAYPKTIAHLKERLHAVVIIVVDLLDFPGSVWPGILDVIGHHHDIILVGNKVDLLPQDSEGYLGRIEKSMVKTFIEKCSLEGADTDKLSNLVSSVLISARTGYNIGKLVSLVIRSWNERSATIGKDVFLLGTTNVGKSSLFNVLLDSDLCKVRGMDCVEKAMASPVPGTTYNLLRFPLARPDPALLNPRLRRLNRKGAVIGKRERDRIRQLQHYRDDRNIRTHHGSIGRSVATGVDFSSKSKPQQRLFRADKYLPLTGLGFDIQGPDVPFRPDIVSTPDRLNPLSPQFADGCWCHDTPGTVSREQIINLMTQDEIRVLLPELPIRPRSFYLRRGDTVLLGGIARLDLIAGPYKRHPLLITIFCSDDLPINILRTADAEKFYKAAFGTEVLGIPRGSETRLEEFPALAPSDPLEVDSIDLFESACEVVLSSAGWISFTPKVWEMGKVIAWTPNGQGIYMRNRPFLPYAHQERSTNAGTVLTIYIELSFSYR